MADTKATRALTRAESLGLLGVEGLAHLVSTRAALPAAFPVRYRVDAGVIVVAPSRDQLPERVDVADRVFGLHLDGQSGDVSWTVMVVGRGHLEPATTTFEAWDGSLPDRVLVLEPEIVDGLSAAMPTRG